MYSVILVVLLIIPIFCPHEKCAVAHPESQSTQLVINRNKENPDSNQTKQKPEFKTNQNLNPSHYATLSPRSDDGLNMP